MVKDKAGKKMNEKCSKYESLFIFGTQSQLEDHLANCEECQREHAKMEQVVSLVKEVKPFLNRRAISSKSILKIAASVFGIFLAFFAIYHTISPDLTQISNNNYGTSTIKKSSEVAQMGFPTDEYGLLKIE